MSKVSRIILVQPPLVQLNSPYPAPYYLKSFLEQRGRSVIVLDHSIGLFEKIFSRAGLEQIFSDVLHPAGISPDLSRAAGPAGKKTDTIIERFLSEKDMWLACIDRLIAFLRGKDNEWGHFLALANGCLPGGPRTDAYLAERGGELSPDETKLVATKMLSDLADFITCTLDNGFGLIRYTPLMEASLNAGFGDFSCVQGGRSNYIMNTFYQPMLAREWERLISDEGASGLLLLGITVPFPGCLVPALVCAEAAKKYFGSALRTVVGGGYVNTELRFLEAPEFFDFFDYVSFDRGYGSLISILEYLDAGEKAAGACRRLYKTMYLSNGIVVAPDAEVNEKADMEDAAVKTTFPDFSQVDFGRYLYPVDDVNSMHRLWSDGHWLKAYLAHGCYWHSCAFCDVGLDYIRNFIPVDPSALFFHLKNQAEQTGIRGIHFCDEAAPVSSLLKFAVLNREGGLPLNFWGNIRFEKDFDPDTAAILAAGGLTGVSAGLEVATENGFKRLGKGIDLESAVRACAAFKEAGILTHAYLIYGYWDEDEQEIIDSAETLRQLFVHGLLDSAFWHKFILTRHSRIYAEKQRGFHASLEIEGELDARGKGKAGSIFALNDLSFKGEEKYGKYAEGLDNLLAGWMAGETERPVTEAFPFRVNFPSVPPDLVAGLLDKYARDRDGGRAAFPNPDRQNMTKNKENILFLGSVPWFRQEGKKAFLCWRWRLDVWKLKTSGKTEAEKIAVLLKSISRSNGLSAADFFSSLEEISGREDARKKYLFLRKSGIVVNRVLDAVPGGGQR